MLSYDAFLMNILVFKLWATMLGTWPGLSGHHFAVMKLMHGLHVFCVFSVQNLFCRLTLDAGYMCQCEIDEDNIIPLNGTACVSKCTLYSIIAYD